MVNDPRFEMTMLISERAERAMQQIGIPDTRQLFYAFAFPKRAVLLVNPNIFPDGLSSAIVRKVQGAMEGRPVVLTLGRILQVGYLPGGQVRPVRQELPGFDGKQVVIYGPTGSGKTSAIQNMLRKRSGKVVVLDAHYAPGEWHPNWIVVGAGRNWGAIGQALTVLVLELENRYQRKARGEVNFEPLHVAVDEMSALTSNIPDAGKQLITLAQEGRKVNIFVVLTPHSTEVRQMGMEGAGDARENFMFIRLDAVTPGQEDKPRTATVFIGNPRRPKNEPAGRYIIPAPVVYQGAPRLVQDLAEVLTVSERVSGGVSEHASPRGHAPDTGNLADFEARYRPEATETRALAEHLAAHGYSVRKISQVLPYRATEARQTAGTAIREVGMDANLRPQPGSQAEVALVHELHDYFGVPAHRIARLLDGPDHINLGRVQAYLQSLRLSQR
ncbi:MAG: hypothetical protein JW726_20130 [Anaerolineales bacterium]|nr:hypothetical protein [Anaerolineales bacterium]